MVSVIALGGWRWDLVGKVGRVEVDKGSAYLSPSSWPTGEEDLIVGRGEGKDSVGVEVSFGWQ